MTRQEQEQLVAAFIAGTASESELQQLKIALTQDPALGQRLSDMLLVEHMLYHVHDDRDGTFMEREVLGALRNEDSGQRFTKKTIDQIRRQQKSPSGRTTTRQYRRRRQRQQSNDVLWIGLATAAAVLLAILLWPRAAEIRDVQEPQEIVQEQQQRPVIASIGQWLDLHAADLRRQPDADQRSSRCFIGDVLIASHACALQLDDQSLISIEAGAQVRISGAQDAVVLELKTGSLRAKITTQQLGSALVFQTDHGQSRIIGTEFSLHNYGKHSRLEVYEGRVQQTQHGQQQSVFVDAGFFVDVVPNKSLQVQSLSAKDATEVVAQKEQPKTQPENVEAPVVKEQSKPLYAWRLCKVQGEQWQLGTYNAGQKLIASELQYEQHCISARLEREKRVTLLAQDEFHFSLRAEQAMSVEVSIFLADRNRQTDPKQQYARGTIQIGPQADWQSHVVRLQDLQFNLKHLLPDNHGCFAFRLAARQPFELKQAHIIRP